MSTDPLKYFRVEARELLDQMQRAALALEKETTAAGVQLLLRHAHTIKGAARIVKQLAIADAAHAIEDLLAPHRSGTPPVRADALLQQLDVMERELRALSPQEAPPLKHETSDIDALIEGLAEAHARLSRVRELDLREDVSRSLEDVDRELWQARERAEHMRLMPAQLLFSQLERTARDAAQQLGKEVQLQMSGGEVRLDSQLITSVQPALVQLIRNAVAHGIDRRGTVTIRLQRAERNVLFTVSDDGRGIDKAAVQQALAKLGRTVALADVTDVLMQGGVTTASGVNAVAGRGVGLDVVRDAAAKLGAKVDVRSEPGQGTTFQLRVPLSLAALQGLHVQAGGVVATVPLESVRRAVLVRRTELAEKRVAYEGKLVPFVHLARVFNGTQTGDAWPTLMLQTHQGIVALGVDKLRGISNVVLRPLPPLATAEPVIAGATLDAEGNPQLVLDPNGLTAVAAAPTASTPRRLPILVVDDSLTTRTLELSILKTAGYDTAWAACAEEALEKVQQTRFGLILCDVEMPGMDGFGFVEQLRTTSQVPVILVTSRSAPEDKARGQRVGAQGFMVKGEFDQRKLLTEIERLL